MFTLAEKYAHDTLGSITVMGLAVLWVMRLIDEPCKAARLAPIITNKPDPRPIRAALSLLEMSDLVSPTGFKGSETWYLTDRGRQLPLPVMPATGYLLASQTSASDESAAAQPAAGMVSRSGATEQTTSAGISASVTVENGQTGPDVGNRRAPRVDSSSSSDLISSDLDQIREDQEEPSTRHARIEELSKVLDEFQVNDNPPRRYRSRLMDDPFITADRFRAAIQAALANPRRTSAVPTGLAISELLNRKTRQKYAAPGHGDPSPVGEGGASAPGEGGTPAGYVYGLHDPVFDQVLLTVAQHYGPELFMVINPRLVAVDERPNKLTVLVNADRPELRGLIGKLAAGYSRKSYQVKLVTAWPGITSGDTQPEIKQRIAALKLAHETLAGGSVYWDTEDDDALAHLASAGCTTEQYSAIYRRKKAEPFWKDKPLKARHIAGQYRESVANPASATPADRSSISRYTTVRA